MVEKLFPKYKIYLDEDVKCQYPTLMLDESDGSLKYNSMKLRLMCYFCGNPRNNQYICGCTQYSHVFCSKCYNHTADLKNFESICRYPNKNTSDMLSNICKTIKFECRWRRCEKMFGPSTLTKHEFSCEAQPKQICPVDECQWSGRIDQLIDHFKQHENSEVILCSTVQQMKSGKTYYLWILGTFVLVQDKMVEIGEVFKHDIKFKLCKQLILGGVKPVCLVSAKNVLLKKIEGDNVIKNLQPELNILVHFEATK